MKLNAELHTTIVLSGHESAALHHAADRTVRLAKGMEANMGKVVERPGTIKVLEDFAKLSGEASGLHERFANMKREMNID